MGNSIYGDTIGDKLGGNGDGSFLSLSNDGSTVLACTDQSIKYGLGAGLAKVFEYNTGSWGTERF